jgi:hypothetical protein
LCRTKSQLRKAGLRKRVIPDSIMETEWILVYTSNKLYEAEILREFLDDNGIETFLMNKQDSSYHIGDIEVYTRPDDVMKAKLLIEKFER